MKITDLNWIEVKEHLQSDDRAVVPLGSTEQHGYLVPKTWVKVIATDPTASHGSWVENSPWNRFMQVACSEHKQEPNDRSPLRGLEPARAREILGDGNYGGRYQRPDAERLAIWQVAVAGTRELLKGA